MVDVLNRNQTFASPSEALAHYGVKGMRWGIRNEDKPTGGISKMAKPPKPKKINVKKAERHESNAAQAQKQIDVIRANPSKYRIAQRSKDNQVKELEDYRDKQLKAAEDVRAGKLTDGQKKVLIGAAAAAAVLAAYGTYKYVDSGQLNAMRTKNVSWKKLDELSKLKDSEDIFSSVVKPINPG